MNWPEFWRAFCVGVAVAAVFVICSEVYAAWRDCSSAGGTTVRGLFWLECIK